MTYSIWLVPTSKDAKLLDGIIKNLAKKYDAPSFSAHVTLFSGITSLNKAKSLVDLIYSGPINAKKIGVGKSDYLWKTLYIRIRKERNIITLHQTMQNHTKTRYVFEPHISLIYKKLDHITKKKIKLDLKIKNTYTFDTIAIIKSSKNVKKWKKLYSVRLNATSRA
jgi:2'-5' RNA ligase